MRWRFLDGTDRPAREARDTGRAIPDLTWIFGWFFLDEILCVPKNVMGCA